MPALTRKLAGPIHITLAGMQDEGFIELPRTTLWNGHGNSIPDLKSTLTLEGEHYGMHDFTTDSDTGHAPVIGPWHLERGDTS